MTSLVFREVRSRLLWSKEREKGEEWLPLTALRADALKSLENKTCALSIYAVETEAHLLRVLGGIAAGKSHVQSHDYILLDFQLLREEGFQFVRSPGQVCDSLAAELHIDLIQLTARRLVDLAYLIYGYAELRRAYDKDVGKLINRHIKEGFIDPQQLSADMSRSLSHLKYAV